ncbi:MAG: hypothetical protein U1D30_06835 [Planctomycetota bacterium]
MPKRNPPATLEDIRRLAEQIASYRNITERRIAESEARLTQHFDLAVEQIRNDLAGANSDEILVLEDRVSKIERRLGPIYP